MTDVNISLSRVDSTLNESEHDGPQKNAPTKKSLGLSFSGGGIRSGALCAGVLKKVLEGEKERLVLSCVSGGGYTGASFVQWCIEKNGFPQGPPEGRWDREFFDQMKANAGFFVTFHGRAGRSAWTGIRGCWHLAILVGAIITWAIISIVTMAPIVFILGNFFDTLVNAQENLPAQLKIRLLVGLSPVGAVFILLLLKFATKGGTTRGGLRKPPRIWRLGKIKDTMMELHPHYLVKAMIATLLLFCLLWLSDLAQEYASISDAKTNREWVLAVLVFLALQAARYFSRSFLVQKLFSSTIVIWLVVQVHVQLKTGRAGQIYYYSDELWRWIVIVSLIAFCFHTLLSSIRFNLWHTVYRSRLINSFFYCDPQNWFVRNTTMGQMTDVMHDVEYIGNTAINHLKIHTNENGQKVSSPSTHTLIMKATETYVLLPRKNPNQRKVKIQLEAAAISMGTVMTLSAAAFALSLGNQASKFQTVPSLLAMGGLNLGQWRWRNRLSQQTMIAIRFSLHFIPFCTYAVFYIKYKPINDLVMSICGLLLFILPLWIGSFFPFFHSSFSRVLSQTLRQNRHIEATECVDGSLKIDDPLDKFVTDGGHDENLALLPLLEDKNVGDIIVMDGGEDSKRNCSDITEVLKKAVEYLDCRFTRTPNTEPDTTGKARVSSFGGTSTDRDNFHTHLADFIVGREQVLMLNYVVPEEISSVKNEGRIFFLKGRSKKVNPNFNDDWVKNTSGICCDCCNTKLSALICCCGKFPNNSTSNVFYTSQAFSTYCDEGYELAKIALDLRNGVTAAPAPKGMSQ